MTYQGWTNYETWAVALWLDNDEGSYRYVRGDLLDSAREMESDTDSVCLILADSIEEMVKDGAPEMDASIYSDLLSAAYSEVNWHEIAKSIMDES